MLVYEKFSIVLGSDNQKNILYFFIINNYNNSLPDILDFNYEIFHCNFLILMIFNWIHR